MINLNTQEVSTKLAGQDLVLKTGHVAFQADGAVTLQLGDLVILVAAAMGGARDGSDFFPLLVDYEEKFYAAGKIKGSRFIKREGRPPDESILKARLIDRPIRPLFPKGLTNDCVISASVLSSDGKIDPGPHSITATSAALVVGGFPIIAPVAGIRIGMMNGELIVNPTYEQVEQGANQVTEEKMMEAIELAHEEIKKLCALQEELRSKAAKTMEKELIYVLPDETLKKELEGMITPAQLDKLYQPLKPDVYKALKNLISELIVEHKEKIESEAEEHAHWSERNVSDAVDKIFKDYMRKNILEKGRRLDGRTLDDVRPIRVDIDVLPTPHGSALFQRGETQILSVATLASPGSA